MDNPQSGPPSVADALAVFERLQEQSSSATVASPAPTATRSTPRAGLPDSLKTVLTLDPKQVHDWQLVSPVVLRRHFPYVDRDSPGVPEAPDAEMRYRAYLLQFGSARKMTPVQRTLYQRLKVRALKARKQLDKATPEWPAYYAKRQSMRQLGFDPDAVEEPYSSETRAEREARLLRGGAIDASGYQFDRGEGARQLRDRARAEQLELKQLLKRRKLEERQRDRLLAARIRDLSPDMRDDLRELRAEQRRRQRWSQRVLEDLRTIDRLQRPMPRAERLPPSIKHLYLFERRPPHDQR